MPGGRAWVRYFWRGLGDSPWEKVCVAAHIPPADPLRVRDEQYTFEGNPTGGLSGADTITVQRDAEFASSSTASSCFGGTLACLGPVTPPGSFDENSATFAITNSGGTFVDDKTFVNNFGAGSPVGSYIVWGQTTAIVPPTPEPASVGLLALGLGAIILRTRYSAPRGHYKSQRRQR